MTASGCETMTTCDASTSVTVAPARSAIERITSAPAGAGYLAARPGVGSGLWVARQLTWLIEFFQTPSGFTTRIWL